MGTLKTEPQAGAGALLGICRQTDAALVNAVPENRTCLFVSGIAAIQDWTAEHLQ